MRELRTARLVLEPQVEAHAAPMFDVLSDPAIYEYEHEPPESLEWLRERLRKLESRASRDGSEQWLNWVVRSERDVMGYLQATIYADRHAAIAYVFASAFWGRGFAREGVEAMLHELHAHHGVRRAVAVFKSANHRSRRLLRDLQFVATTGEVEADEEIMERMLS